MSTLARYISAGLLVVLTTSIFLFGISFVYAQPSYTMNYQGKLTNNSGLAVADGTYAMEFKLYTQSSGGSAIWTETRSGGNVVTVTNGLFSVMLGSVTSLSSVNFNQPLYLGVNIASDGEMTPRKALGTVPSAFEAKQLGGVASTSFLRSDAADSASGLLTFTGGVVSTASSSIARFNFTNATGTSLYIGGDRIIDFSGTNLEVVGNSLGLSSTYLGQTSITTLGTVGTGTWQGSAISSAYLDTGVILSSEIDTSSELAAILGDETGTGNVVFSASPTFTGTLTAGYIVSNSGGINITGSNALQFSSNDVLRANSSYTSLNVYAGGYHSFTVAGNEKMRIIATGNVGIGTTSPYAKLSVSGQIVGGYMTATSTTATSSFPRLYASTAFRLGSDYVTDLTGTGLAISGNALTVSLANDYITPNMVKTSGQTDEYCLTYEGTGTTFEWQTCASGSLSSTDIDTSSELAGILGDETGTGSAVFSASPTFTGTVNAAAATLSSTLTMSGSAANIALGSNYLSGDGGDEGVFVDSSGYVGIGTTTPNNLLQVYDLINFNNTDTNSFLGYQTGKYFASGATNNTFVGYRSGYGSSTASTNGADGNTGVGYFSLNSNTTGYYNAAFGFDALKLNTGGFQNTAMGTRAIDSNLLGFFNVAVGADALQSITSSNYNTAIGTQAAYSSTGGAAVAVGYQSSYSNTTGYGNVVLGFQSFYSNTTGSYNVAAGFAAGRYLNDGATLASTTDYSIFLGNNAKAFTNNDQNTIVIGYNTNGIGSNTVVLGNDSIVTTALKGNVGIGTTTPTAKLDVQGSVEFGTSNIALITSAGKITGLSSTYFGTDTSANLATILTDETGTGNAVFSASPTFTGTAIFANTGIQVGTSVPFSDAAGTLTIQNIDALDATTETTIETAIDTLGSLTSASSLATVGTITSGTWGGSFSNNIVTPNAVFTTGQTDEYCLTYEATGTTWEWQSCGAGYLTTANIDTSSELDTIVTDNTGSGALVFGTNPTLTGNTVTLSSLTASRALFLGSASQATTTATSAFLLNSLTDETGTGVAVFATSPTLVTPNLGTPSTLVGTNITGTAAGLTAGTVTTNANLTGAITSTGNATVLGSFTSSNLLTALTDETGTGSAVFSASPTFTGTVNAAAATLSSTLTMSGSAANITLGSNYLSGDGGDEGVFVDASGNVGVGTASPDELLQIAGSGTSVTLGQLNTNLRLQTNTSTVGAGNEISFRGLNTAAENVSTYAAITAPVTGNSISGSVGYLSFSTKAVSTDTSLTERIRLTASGNLGLGTTTPGALLDVQGAAQFGTSNIALITSAGKITGLSSTYFGTDTSANLATILTDESGTGVVAYTTSPVFTTPNLGTPSALTLTNATGLPIGGLTGLGTGVGTALAVNIGSAGSFVVDSGALGTPSSGTLTNTTGLPIVAGTTGTLTETRGGTNQTTYATGDMLYASGANTLSKRSIGSTGNILTVSGGVPTWSATSTLGLSASFSTSAGLAALLSDETGTGLAVFGTSPTFTTYANFGSAGVRLSDDGDGGLTFLGLGNGSDEDLKLDLDNTANTGVFTSSTGLTQLTFSGIGINTTAATGYSMFGTGYLYASTTNDSISLGESAGRLYNGGALNNVAIGYQAGYSATSSDNNTLVGYQAGYGATSANANVAIGYQALYTSTSSTNNIAIGYQALRSLNGSGSTGAGLVAIGYQSLYTNTSGHLNVAISQAALRSNTSGSQNIGIGYGAGYWNTTGSDNVFIGQESGAGSTGLTTGSSNIAVGRLALNQYTTGSYNSVFGRSALGGNKTGNHNTVLGYFASLYNVAATTTVAIGSYSSYGAAVNYSNQGGTTVGYQSGYSFQTGSHYNTLIGYLAGYNITTGQYNTYLGSFGNTGGVTTGSNNVLIGQDVRSGLTVTASNQLNVGNLIFGTGLSSGTTLSTGKVGIGTSTPNQKLGIFASAADSAIEFSTVSGSAEKWTVGIDDSDAAKFKISSSSALGTNDRFVIDGSGYVGVGDSTPTGLLTVGASDNFVINTSGVITSSDNISANSLKSSGQVDEYCLTYEGTGTTFEWQTCSAGGGLASTDIDTSSELATILTDETGTGRAVFSISPAFSGTPTFAALTATSTLTMSGTAANIALGSNYLSGDGGDEGVSVGSTGAVTITPATTFTTGSILSTAAAGATTLSGTITGETIDLRTNYTATGFGITGSAITLANVANTAAGTYTYYGQNIGTSGGTLSHSNAAGATTFIGTNITNPNITQSSTGVLTANGVSVTTGSITSGGIQTAFNVAATGIGTGSLYGINISSISPSTGTENAINISTGWDRIFESSVFELAGSGAVTHTPLTNFTSGTIYSIGASGATTLAGALTGVSVNLSSSYTANNQSATGASVTLPAASNTGASNYNYQGLTVSGGTMTQQTLAGNTTFNGVSVTNPQAQLLSGGGTAVANGISVTTGAISTGGTQQGINISASGVTAGTLNGINIGSITAAAGSENAIAIGTGWDTILNTSSIDISGTGAVTGATSYNGLVITANTGAITTGSWTASAISSTYLDTSTILSTEIDTSAELAAILGDETGTGAAVFAASPTLSGTLSMSGNIQMSAADPQLEFNSGGARLWGLSNALAFHTGSGIGSTASEMMRLTTTGLGIGDTTPAAMLTVGSGDLFQVNSSGAIAASTAITTSGNFTLSGWSANILLGSNFLSGDGGDEGISVDSSGNVGALQDQFSVCSGGACASTANGDGTITAERAITSEQGTVTAGASITLNWDDGNQQYLSLTTNSTIGSFTNNTTGQTLRLIVCQDATGGRTFTFSPTIKWSGGTTPTQTSTANKCDVYSFIQTTAGTLGSYNQNF